MHARSWLHHFVLGDLAYLISQCMAFEKAIDALWVFVFDSGMRSWQK